MYLSLFLPMDEEFSFESAFPEIPREFYSFETGKPFSVCLECGLPLIDASESPYIITRAIQNDEPLLEWAMCGDCSERFREEISSESQDAISSFLANAKTGPDHILRSPEEKTSYCFICARNRSDLLGYTIQAICSGGELLNMQAPLLVCHDCEEEASELLSKETRDHYDRFFEQHFGGPPGAAVDPEIWKLISV